jgi:flavin-dependent dehydrogenase
VYDIVIVGGSFAGLAAAMQLRDRRVLIAEQYPIGGHQTSTCGMPLATIEAIGGAGAIQAGHDALVVHTGGRAIRFPLRTPYVTFDYRALCRAMLAQTDAEVRRARAIGSAPGMVATDAGPEEGRFVVDASGWRSPQWRGPRPAPPARLLGYGIETELPARPTGGPGLHFFFERGIVRSGYAWVFPCGETTRIGVCSFDRGVALRPILAAFLDRFGLRCGATHGGVMAIQRAAPLDGPVLVVGDAAGQCLPLTAEGIRTAIFHGREAGRLIAAALAGDLSPEGARARYRATARRTARFHAFMVQLQHLMARSPEGLRIAVARAYSRPAIIHPVMRCYLQWSGWV